MHITSSYKYIFLLIPWVILLFLMPLYPQQSLNSAIHGIMIWWEVLFPALFPFFVISDLLLALGLVHFIGGLFDPMMRPVFRIPGYGGFVMAMGFAAGYPVSAKLTSKLWEQRLINRDEAERLVAFTTTSDPIFLVGAVAVGFFHNPGLGVILAISHYGGGIILGLLMRFHGSKTIEPQQINKHQGSLLKRAFDAMHQARIQDNRSFGVMLMQAIQGSLKLVFMIGGLVIFISVVLELLTQIGIMSITFTLFSHFLQWVHLPSSLSSAFINGFFEVTVGAKSAGSTTFSVPLIHKAAAATFILSWGGLCVHAQITSILTSTNLRYTPFIIARFIHGLIAMLLVYILWTPVQSLSETIQFIMPVSTTDPLAPTFQFSLFIALAIALFTLFLIPLLFIIFTVFKHLLSTKE